eukprot:scaffold12655_cov21-Tisochrysis_lutea.AAC.1
MQSSQAKRAGGAGPAKGHTWSKGPHLPSYRLVALGDAADLVGQLCASKEMSSSSEQQVLAMPSPHSLKVIQGV